MSNNTIVLGDCDRGYGINYPACSGNGVCEPETNKCLCFKGWSSLADFQIKDGVDCDIHLPTILSFACICLVTSFFGAVICLTALYSTGLKKTNGTYAKQMKIIVLLFAFLGGILQSSLKICDTEKNSIGSSPGSALGYILFTWLVCLAWSYFIEEQATFLRKSCRFIDGHNSSHGLDSQLNNIKRFTNVPPSAAFLTSMFTVLAETDPSRCDSYAIGLIGALVVTFSLYYALVLNILPLFVEEMSKLISARPGAPENETIQRIHDETNNALVIFILLVCFLVPPMLVFMFWGFMRRKFTYHMWFNLMAASIVASVIAMSFIPKSSIRIKPANSTPNSPAAGHLSAAVVISVKPHI